MCICCSAKAITVIQDVLPGYSLVTPTTDVVDSGDGSFLIGQFGLVRSNNPDFIWPISGIARDPYFGKWGDESCHDPIWDDPIKDSQFNELTEYVYSIESMFKTDPVTGYFLVSAAIEAGYNQSSDGSFLYWLMDYIARKIEEAKVSCENQGHDAQSVLSRPGDH